MSVQGIKTKTEAGHRINDGSRPTGKADRPSTTWKCGYGGGGGRWEIFYGGKGNTSE